MRRLAGHPGIRSTLPIVLVSLGSVLAALAVGLVLIALLGVNIGEAVAAFWDGAFGSSYSIAVSINRSVAFALVGLGFVFANRANLITIGGEGQICVGAIAAAAVALYGGAANLGGGLGYLLPLAAAALAGGVWGAIAGIMKARTGTSEVISTLLLSFIGVWLLYWCVQSTNLLRQPMTTSATLPESLEIPDATKLPLLTGDYAFPLHMGLVIAILITVLVAVILTKSTLGLRLQVVGLNALAARRAGIPIVVMTIIALGGAGLLGGLAGGIMLLGEQHVLKDGFSSGYGFDGLVAGLLSRGSVVGLICASLLFGFLRSGGINMEMVSGVPSALVVVIQGVIVLALAAASYVSFRGAR